MEHEKACALVARYATQSMTFSEIADFVENALYQDMVNNVDVLYDYMDELGFKEETLEELRG